MHAPFLTIKLLPNRIVYKKNMRGRVRVRPQLSCPMNAKSGSDLNYWEIDAKSGSDPDPSPYILILMTMVANSHNASASWCFDGEGRYHSFSQFCAKDTVESVVAAFFLLP